MEIDDGSGAVEFRFPKIVNVDLIAVESRNELIECQIQPKNNFFTGGFSMIL